MATNFYPNAPDLSADDYIVIGLATCFIKEEEKFMKSKSLFPLRQWKRSLKGIPTSHYQLACATTLGAVAGDTPNATWVSRVGSVR